MGKRAVVQRDSTRRLLLLLFSLDGAEKLGYEEGNKREREREKEEED